MRRVLSHSPLKTKGSLVPLDANEAKHLTSVLRLGPDDEIHVLDGEGHQVRAKLVFRDKSVFAELLEAPTSEASLCSLPIHLFMSVIKGEAMEWVVEKAVELGVRSLTPIETEFTVVKIHKRGADTFQERWQRIADQALKQCGRLDRMVIEAPIGFEDALLKRRHFIWLDETFASANGGGNGSGARSEGIQIDPHLAAQLQTLAHKEEFALLVGPEGGFSPVEKNRLLQLTSSNKHEITRASLGALILRAETAALFGISILIGDHHGKRKN